MQSSFESFLFTYIDYEKGYAVPSKNFWELWNSPKRDAIRRLGFQPRPYGELVGSDQKWVVSLPRHRHIDIQGITPSSEVPPPDLSHPPTP